MEKIPSFTIDHNQLLRGIYVSRKDVVGNEVVTTFDIRMKAPNREPALHVGALHTIEHLAATYLRNDAKWKDRVVYWGPMGCLTGCYLIMKGKPAPQDLLPLMISAFEYLRDYDDVIPGAQAVNCGNYLLHDLPMAKYEANLFVKILKENPCFDYPQSKRINTEKGLTFFDS